MESQGTTLSRTLPLFYHFSKHHEQIPSKNVRAILQRNGFLSDDPKWQNCYEKLLLYDQIDVLMFNNIFSSRTTELRKAVFKELVINTFNKFCHEITNIYIDLKNVIRGKVADYIPQLARVDPEKLGISVCTIDGQRHNEGNFDESFCIQSCSFPITYAIALEKLGEEVVHKYVDKEPSGQSYKSMVFTDKNMPYNPMINSGAIAVCSLIEAEDASLRFEETVKWYTRLAGGKKPGYNNSVFLAEQASGTINYAMAYSMRGFNTLYNRDIQDVLDYYYQCCSIEMSCNNLSIIAATLANGGVCPLTKERVLSSKTVRSVLSMMYSCGMYNYSGQYSFTVGIPSKGSVSGAMIIVVPGVCGFCVWSPKLDKYGNSVRGIEFAKRLVHSFEFHNFHCMKDPNNDEPKQIIQNKKKYSNFEVITCFLFGCAENDITSVRRFILNGIDVNITDYDKRTGLHLAASESCVEVVEYLLQCGANPNAVDRHGNTPIDDALRINNKQLLNIFNKWICGNSLDKERQ